MCASSAGRQSAACCCGVLAFQVSQIGAMASRSIGCPASVASSINSEISAPLPRWDSTCATVQSRS